jgi:hypothetical protein
MKMFKKRNLKEIDIVYKGVDLHVKYNITSDSFDHERGTEILPDYPELHTVMCDPQDITEMLTDSQVEDIQQLIKESWNE